MASPLRSAGCLALLAVTLLAPACERATRSPRAAPEGLPEVAWPAAPARPRVRFVRSVTGPADFGIRPSFWERVGRLVAGGEDRRFVRPTGVAARGETRSEERRVGKECRL